MVFPRLARYLSCSWTSSSSSRGWQQGEENADVFVVVVGVVAVAAVVLVLVVIAAVLVLVAVAAVLVLVAVAAVAAVAVAAGGSCCFCWRCES